MRQTQLFTKTSKTAPKDEVSRNASLLIRAGYIHKEMAGVYTFLPLGLRVLNKIENIIRAYMNPLGNEVLMTVLSPIEKWKQTGRIETVDVLMKTIGANEASFQKSSNSYILNSTHEELITPIAQENAPSYKDFPLAYYQIQTKLRNEARAKSGLLRGREFRMKDLYSFHLNEDDLKRYYDEVKVAYKNIYHEFGIGNDTFLTLASGGDFTPDFSHEFQTLVEAGEDLIYLDRKNNIAYNKEVVTPHNEARLGVKFDTLEQVRACEVGNIFPLNVKFSQAFGYTYKDREGNSQPVYMGCYGLGSTRVMGVLVEKFADAGGLVWPESVAPFRVQLLSLGADEKTNEVYSTLTQAGIEVLYDDREVSAGEKFADADLLGIPYRVVIGRRSLESGNAEVKSRKAEEIKAVPFDSLVSFFTKKS